MSKSSCEFIFGGTFDPIHLGHLEIIKALNELSPNHSIRIIPCAIPPLKDAPQTSFKERLNMISLATKSFANVLIDSRESQRDKPSYTIDTLHELNHAFPENTFIFVMGADSIASFKQWHDWQQLANFCHLVIVNRDNEQDSSIEELAVDAGFKLAEQFTDLAQGHGVAMSLKMPAMPHASKQIRKTIAAGHPLDSLLPQSVIEYIRQNHLYESD